MSGVYHVYTKTVLLYTILLGLPLFASAQPPSAAFTATPISGCSPLIVNFQDQSTGNPTAWLWDFGNGNTSTLQNPSATYFTPGQYTVSLRVTNAAGSNTLTRSQYITVEEPPTVAFSAIPVSGCFPLRVQFTDLSTPGAGNTNTSWQWDFGNGTTSTLQNPLITYNAAGIFTVTLRVVNDKGCTKTITRPGYITVTPGVTAAFTQSNPTVCSAPATINFTNNSSGPPVLSYQWDFGDGNFSNLLSPSHTYTANGTFNVVLVTTSSAGCQDTARSTVVIGGFNTNFTAPLQVCINEPATFTNASTPVPQSSAWDFGDGGTATTINATHTYSAPGVYNVWLHNNYGGCIDSILQQITVNPRPVAAFTAPVRSRCEPPLTVNFQDLSTGGAVSWQWDFGDGNTSTLQNPSHTYTSYGSFDVSLIVANNSGCTDTLVLPGYIVINRAQISVTGLPVTGCVPITITPVPTVTAVDVVTSWLWDFGDGNTSTLQNPTHTYIAQGTYTVKLFITTSTGCTDSLVLAAAVRIGTKPVADFSATPIPVCGKQPVYFTDLSAPADEWHWYFGDGGNSNSQNPIHSYSDTGYFTITLIALNNGCPDTVVKTNYVRVLPPIAAFNVTPDCNNRLRFTFTDQSVAPLTWEWNFGDGSPLDNTQNPVHIFPAYGSYNVRLIVTNGGCADTATTTINAVNESPDFVATPLVQCKGGLTNFTVNNINPANITFYNWTFGDGGTTTLPVPTASYTYTQSGTYTVTLLVRDINGCTNTITKPNYIRVNGPLAGFAATDTSGCVGLTTQFQDQTTTDGLNSIVSWYWDFGDGNTQTYTAPPFAHTYTAAGNFSVTLIVTDAYGCRDTITRPRLITTTNPQALFNVADTLTCPGAQVQFNNTSNSNLPTTYSWNFGDGNTSPFTNPLHTYTATGIYTVTLSLLDSIGCADTLVRPLYIHVDLPAADFQVSDSVSSCLPFEVRFTNTSTFYTSSVWDFGPLQGTSTLNDPVHYYSVPGIYPVKLIVTSPGGCVDSITKTIRVYDTVGTRMNYVPLGGCKPLNVSLNTFTAGPIRSYYWDFGDGYILNTTSPTVTHLYNSFGNFLPKVIMEDLSGCIIPLQGLDTVFVIGANTKFGLDDSLFCDFGTVNFTDSTTFNDPLIRYSWSFGDGNTSNLQNPSHFYANPGLYTVQLAVETQRGCRDTLTKPLVIRVIQRPLVDIGGDSVVCVNNFLQHDGLFIIPDTSVVSWQWTFPNGNTYTNQHPPPQLYTVPGTYTITAIATNSSGCKDTTRQQVIVHPLPQITMPGQMTVQQGFPVTIPATYSPNVVSWIWSPAAGLSCTNCPTPDAGPKFDTRYQVFVRDVNGCTNYAGILVTVICKNANLFIPNTFSPNGDGSNDVFYPRGRGLERVKSLRIFNRWGEVVFEKLDFPVNDAAAGWNGTFKGRKPQADVYVYQAEVFCENGDIIKLNGNIALVL